MKRNFLDEVSQTLILAAEHACEESDPDMTAAAAMVFVGDVYALQICRETAGRASERDLLPTDDALSPFIR